MKGKINEKGFFLMERAGDMKMQSCRYTVHTRVDGISLLPCGDWCQSFHEPETIVENDYGKTEAKYMVRIQTCDSIHVFDIRDFVDGRKEEQND